MDKNVVIKVENLAKKFTRGLRRSMFYGATDSIRTAIGLSVPDERLRPSEFWALKDINLELKKGERLGLVGANGSGKSTLLRLLTGIFPPSTGKITIRGRVGALIAVDAGFHPHMSGRENIYLNGTIMGMKRHVISKKLDEIIAFADIPDGAIDAPVSTYSSGMRARLGFSVAIHVEPEILLVDEVLSVGDWAFTVKCRVKIHDYIKNGGTMVFTSHNEEMVRSICNNALWLNNGMIALNGRVQDVTTSYANHSVMVTKLEKNETEIHYLTDDISDAKLSLINSQGTSDVKEFKEGENIIIQLEWVARNIFALPNCFFTIIDCSSGARIYFEKVSLAKLSNQASTIKDKKYVYQISSLENNLGRGIYYVNVYLTKEMIHDYYVTINRKEICMLQEKDQEFNSLILDKKFLWKEIL